MSQPQYPGQPDPQQQPWSGQPYSGQPQPGQPQPGQPQPGQPLSGQPQSGQPQPPYPPAQPQYPPGQPQYPPTQPYQAPPPGGYPPQQEQGYGYPPPQADQGYGYPQPSPLMQPTPPPKKKSRTLPIVLVSIAVFLVLCVGGSTAIFLAVRNTANSVTVSDDYSPFPTSAPTTVPTTEPTEDDPAPTTEPTPEKKVSISEPRTLGGRPRLTDAAFKASVDALRKDLETIPGATDTVGGLYGTAAKRNVVVIAAVEAPLFDPEGQLDRTFTSEGLGLQIRGVTTVEPGPLGGAAKCGRSSTSGIAIAMCAWADNGSAGWVIWYFKELPAAKSEFAKLRGQIEKSS